ncbi:MAG: hypothetical protein LH614_19800 [Pyrinomonadaceae bacterium]|nr:hypothetical protein [Pyrinomonadaceae bacterium]
MKKLVFVMLFGLMLMVTGSASAQDRSCKSADPSDNEVFIYLDINFGGTCVRLEKVGSNFPKADTLGLPNDSISSIKVGNGVRALVCIDYDYKGDCQSHLQNWSDLSNTVVGNDQISSIKVLQKRKAVQMTFFNRTDKAIRIYELVGGVNSYLGTVDPNAGALIGSDVMTSIVGMIDGKEVGGRFQIKDESAKEINIGSNNKGAIQMTLKQ